MINYEHCLKNSEYAESLLKVLRVILIAPLFLYYSPPLQVYLSYYAFCLFFSLIALFFGIGRNAKADPFTIWLFAWLMIAVTLDLITGSPKITFTAELMYSLSVLLMVIVFNVKFSEMAILVMGFAGAFYVYEIVYLGYGLLVNDHGRAVAVTIVSLVYIVKKKYKIGFLCLLPVFPLIGRNAWLSLFVSLFLWYAVSRFGNSAVIRKVVLIVVLIGAIAIPIVVGMFFGDSLEMFLITTQRSLFYSIMVDEILNRGLDIFVPTSNLHAEKVLTEYLIAGHFEGFGEMIKFLERYYRIFSRQVPHSAYLEILVNYGIIIMAVMMLWLVKVGNSKITWPLIVHFMVAIMTDSGYFTPLWIIPYCIAYRELYFYNDQSNNPSARQTIAQF